MQLQRVQVVLQQVLLVLEQGLLLAQLQVQGQQQVQLHLLKGQLLLLVLPVLLQRHLQLLPHLHRNFDSSSRLE